MRDILQGIAQAEASKLEMLLDAVIQRYAVLYPDWELNVISVQKSTDRNAQLDRLIAFLQNMKNKL